MTERNYPILDSSVTRIGYQSGIALIQTLLIVMVVSLLALQFSYTARDQVQQTSLIEQRIANELLVYSLQQQAVFGLLTNQRFAKQIPPSYLSQVYVLSEFAQPHTFELKESLFTPASNEYSSKYEWIPPSAGIFVTPEGNMNEPVDFNTATVTLKSQDLGGLLPLHYPSHPLWPYFLKSKGWSEQKSQEFLLYLQDLQDSDLETYTGLPEPALTHFQVPYLNMRFTHRYQIDTYLVEYPEVLDWLGKEVRYTGDFAVSLSHAPQSVLQSVMNEDAAAQISDLRLGGFSTRNQLKTLTNIYNFDESVSFSPSVVRRITITVQWQDILSQVSYDVTLSALNTPPYYLLNKQYY